MTLPKTLDPDAQAFFESDMPASAWLGTPTITDPLSDEAFVIGLRETYGRKFDATDMSDSQVGDRLYDIVERWLPEQTKADLPFLRSVARRFVDTDLLSDAQAAGAINCYYASLLRSGQQQRQNERRERRKTTVGEDAP